MIHLERQKSRVFARIYFKEDSFCTQFLPRQFELFELLKEEQINFVNNNFSSYECDKYIQLFERFKNLKKFKFDKIDNIILNNKNVGWLCMNAKQQYTFYLNSFDRYNKKESTKYVKNFSSMNEAKDYISKNYALIQVKYNLYLQNDCI